MHGIITAVPRRSTFLVEHPCKFGTVVRALWPEKPALNLSQRVGCTERHAEYLINGQRKVSARALLALMVELLPP